MSTESLPRDQGAIPPLTLGRRLHIAMEHGEISRERMAMEIGTSPSTISRWTKDKFERPPLRAALQKWASVCGVSEVWLIDGQGDIPSPPAFPTPAPVTLREIPGASGRGKRSTRRNTAYCSLGSGAEDGTAPVAA